MLNNLSPIVKIPLKYGLFASLIGIVLIVVFFFSNRHPLLIPIFYDYRIFLFGVFIFFGVKEFKQYYNDDRLHFWQGLIIGVIIYVTVGILVSLFIIIYVEVHPEFLSQYIEGTIRGLELNKDQLLHQSPIKITEEEYQAQIDLLRNIPSWKLGQDYFIKSCIIGFFLAIILAVFLRRTEDRFKKSA